MSRIHGGVQKLRQQELGQDIPSVRCLNHRPHLVVGHTMSAETAVVDFFFFFHLKFCKQLTVAVHYKGVHLKRLLEERCMGELVTTYISHPKILQQLDIPID